METFYMSCVAGGVLFAIVTLLFGDWFGWMHGSAFDFFSWNGHHVIQPMSVVGGITVLGGTGWLLERYSRLSEWPIAAVSAICAIAAGIAVFFLYIRPMERSENSAGYAMSELSGAIAEVLIPIPEGGYGEVLVKTISGVSGQIAASFDGTKIPSGERVVIVEVKKGTLYVSKLEL